MKYLIITALLFSIVSISLVGRTTPAHAKPPLNNAIKRQEQRNEYTRFESVIDMLGVIDGMTILDIGSGPGYASFLFAEKLHGSGKVFATDIRKDFVDHIALEAKKRGLKNLLSTVVQEEGFDPFYAGQRYDLVFLSNVYHCIGDRINYFSKLRNYLKPGARLVLILYNQVPYFIENDVSDMEGLVVKLAKEPADSPFVKCLSPVTRQLLKDNDRSEELEGALIKDFNGMLTDPQFYKSFYKNSYFDKGLFNPIERDYANWLLMSLREDGVLDRPRDQIDARSMRTVMQLNRLFFIKKLGDFLEHDGRGDYIPAGDANRQTSKYVMFREMDTAGYKPLKEIRVSPYFDAVLMTPKSP